MYHREGDGYWVLFRDAFLRVVYGDQRHYDKEDVTERRALWDSRYITGPISPFPGPAPKASVMFRLDNPEKSPKWKSGSIPPKWRRAASMTRAECLIQPPVVGLEGNISVQ